MKLNPAERHLYTILAERAEMTLEEWIQSLPRQQLAQLEAEDPEDYQSLMMDFAQHMLAGGADSPNDSTKKEANWHVCPACKQKKYASAYPGDSTICRMCTRKQAEEKHEDVVEEAAPEPTPDDGRYKTCGRCGEKRYKSVFAPGQTVCKHCQKEEAEAHSQAQADPPAQTDNGTARTVVPAAVGGHTKKCIRCEEVKPADQFSIIAKNCCNACMDVAKVEAGKAIARRNEGA